MPKLASSFSTVQIGKLDPVRINFMVAGIGGIGKSTFLKSFFELYNTNDFKKSCESLLKDRTVTIQEVGDFVIESTNVDIHFHLIDTPGYGDKINNQDAINNIVQYQEMAHEQWSTLDTRTMTRKVMYSFELRSLTIF
jgi:septin family protein